MIQQQKNSWLFDDTIDDTKIEKKEWGFKAGILRANLPGKYDLVRWVNIL